VIKQSTFQGTPKSMVIDGVGGKPAGRPTFTRDRKGRLVRTDLQGNRHARLARALLDTYAPWTRDPETTLTLVNGTPVLSLGPKDAQADADRAVMLAEAACEAIKEHEAKTGEPIGGRRARYVVCPGDVTSRTEQRHHISASRLMTLYGADPSECVVVNVGARDHHPIGWPRLRPRHDGHYELPTLSWGHADENEPSH
jgi:hypothetical protein